MIDLRLGHTLEKLREIPDESVQCIVTSPPYWGLRAYGTEPQVWLNGHEPCAEHQWNSNVPHHKGQVAQTKWANVDTVAQGGNKITDTCSLCGAWRGELGLEPTPELYIEHLTQIFREARRVLRDDGTLWLNLGDSYANNPSTTKIPRIEQGNGSGVFRIGDEKHTQARRQVANRLTPLKENGFKHKDLIGIPWRVAFALQADGWYLRQDIIWAKPNPMPESVRDRCTKAHEYVFLMSKSPRYYFDNEAIREPINPNNKGDIRAPLFGEHRPSDPRQMGERRYETIKGANKRSVWTVTTQPFKGAHFATFPPKLIEPMILAGCPVGGTVLDPFNGSGTTGLVAVQLGRNYIGIELKPEYVEMTKRRLENVQMRAEG